MREGISPTEMMPIADTIVAREGYHSGSTGSIDIPEREMFGIQVLFSVELYVFCTRDQYANHTVTWTWMDGEEIESIVIVLRSRIMTADYSNLSEEERKIIRATKKKAAIVLALIFLLIVFSVLFLIYHFDYSMNALPGGRLINTVLSPDHRHQINLFAVDEPMDPESYRGEVEDLKSGDRKNIFWQQPDGGVAAMPSVFWINSQTVSISGQVINIYWGKFDSRHQ